MMCLRLLQGRVCLVEIGRATRVGRGGVVLFYKWPQVAPGCPQEEWERPTAPPAAHGDSRKHMSIGVKMEQIECAS